MLIRITACAALLAGLLVVTAYAENYLYLTDSENAIGSSDRIYFFSGDTLDGWVRSNDTIAIRSTPVFYDLVITSAFDFNRGPGFNPLFLGPDPVYDADSLDWPGNATWIRDGAIAQGHYFQFEDSTRARVRIVPGGLQISWATDSLPFDTLIYVSHSLEDSSVVFFDCPVQLTGVIDGVLIFGASQNISLEDNVVYTGTSPLGVIPENCTSKFVMYTDSSIVVLNTVANGANNSNGLGLPQPNQNFSSIVITGMIVALHGQLTFEQQNNDGDEYQGPTPDERGWIRIRGGLMQEHRGYVRRNNHQGTGYRKDFRKDPRLVRWDFGIYDNHSPTVSLDTLDFGFVHLDITSWQTMTLVNGNWGVSIDSFQIGDGPFYVEAIQDLVGGKVITIRFTPREALAYEDSIVIFSEYTVTTIPIRGHGYGFSDISEKPAMPDSFSFSAYPNPFNLETFLSFDLASTEQVRLDVFDAQGRLVRSLVDDRLTAGSRTMTFNGLSLSTGIYFARLSAGANVKTTKLLLLK